MMWNKISHFNLTAVAILLQRLRMRVSFQPIFAEILQGTETKAAAATLVHTSIQTFSHLASGTLWWIQLGIPKQIPGNTLLTDYIDTPSMSNFFACRCMSSTRPTPKALKRNRAAYLQNSCLAPNMTPQVPKASGE